MSLCLVAMMGTTLIPQPIQAEEVSEFEEESFEETTVEFEEATFEEESNQVAESSVESSRKTPVLDTFDDCWPTRKKCPRLTLKPFCLNLIMKPLRAECAT